MDVLAALVSRITRTPWIFREANSEEAAQFRGRKEKVRQLVSRWAKCIVSNSESGFNYWRKIKPTGNIRVIENGIPPEVLSYHKEAGLLQGESRKNIIFAGRLKDHKNIETLLLAFSLCEFDDSLHLLICGTGKHEDYLRSLAKSLNIINQVEFLGHVEQDVLLALMSHALLFVNPSTYEGCPNTVLEAMACMCPVAVSEIPAHKTVLDNESGFFFEPMDYEMLSRILIQVKTPDSMKSKANKARALVENYTIDRMTERYVRLYNDVLQ